MAMYNQCPHFDEGILPMCRKKHRTSLLLVISLLVIILPRTSIGAAPKYETAYACEGKTLTIECDSTDIISLIRANYGRFSITICNDHGNVEWSVNCMSPKSLRVLHSKCAHKQNCSVLASTNMFGDPCPGTHKYLEAHYQCISAAQTSTTTNRPSPPWLITSQPNIWSTSTVRSITTTKIGSIHDMVLPQTIPKPSIGEGSSSSGSSSSSSINGSGTGSGSSSSTEIHLAGRPPSMDHNHRTTTWSIMENGSGGIGGNGHNFGGKVYRPTTPSSGRLGVLQSTKVNASIDVVDIKDSNRDFENNNGTIFDSADKQIPLNKGNQGNLTTLSPLLNTHTNTIQAIAKSSDNQFGDSNSVNSHQGNPIQTTQSTVNNNYNNYDVGDSSYYCGPTTARNLFWNITRVGEVNAQPCPGGATGIAKWRCILIQRNHNQDENNVDSSSTRGDCDKYCDINRKDNDGAGNGLQPTWHPTTPDLTQCRSLWLNNLEIRVNQRDSSLISIANDLSQVTSSKTLYGGDMLVTTKIIQTMSEKMTYDIVTFPDQRQREAIIYELLHGVVKTGSNLLDFSQQVSWLDLSFEDQMRVATSLLTGLEDNAFLLADTIIRERNVVQKVKNILLSVRVLETRNIITNEVFPDAKLEHWQVSDDQIELPRGALIENSEGGLVRIVFVAFDRLELILKPSYDNLDVKFSTNYIQKPILNQTNPQQRIRILNSKVISASLGKGRHIQLSQPIRLILRHLKTENVTNPTCVFWNYIDHAWSEDGCYLESTNRTHTICMCNHLTNFAILMDIVDEHSSSLLSMFDSNKRILIYISVAICIIFIIIAILTLKLFNGVFVKNSYSYLLQSTRTSIYKNIYVCLFIIEILFLLGIEQSEMSLLCGFTTAFLHCFILSAIAWLFLEGFQLYVTLTTDDMLLEVENSSKIIWYYLLSYGLSLTIVAISLAVDPSSYTQSDFCILMESNVLFYTTFVTPMILFVVGDIGYTILAFYILCKKNKTTLKNKEHSRLTSVRFELRCSLIFLIILSADWIFAYFYLRKTKHDEDVSNTYGYLFISFNSLLGLYIFIFHCIQNEKIRREYRKYVRQNSWLPKCLRCSKTASITSSASHNQNQHYGTAASKKSPIALPVDTTVEGIVSRTPKLSAPSYLETSGTCTGTLQQHLQTPGIGAVSRGHRHNIILERASGATLRTTPSGGHTSPTSSAGSTHLIFNSAQNEQAQDWNYQQSEKYFPSNQTATSGNDITSKNLNTYDDKFLYYDCKSKRLKQHPTNLRNLPQAPHQQHEYFYWTEKNNRKKNNGDIKNIKTDTVHAFYPSYKKTMVKHFPSAGVGDDDKLSDSDFPEIENERKYLRYQPTKHQHQQHSSDEDHADSHLIHSGTSSSHPSDCFPQDLPSYRQHYRHRHPSCDLSNEFASSMPSAISYYNQSSGPDEPVYEEILNSQMPPEMCEQDNDDDDDDNDIIMEEERYNRLRRMIACKEDAIRKPFSRQINKGNFDFISSKCYRKSPTSHSSSTIDENTPSHRPQQQQQQIVGRNISAMLDENNAVVCYLEPLPK